MRGTPLWQTRNATANGIIPAYAGNTRIQQRPDSQYEDHPRVCGEHATKQMCRNFAPGSSPRMRGTHELTSFSWEQCGIIPAYAGNTPVAYRFRQSAWDHPRVCGEHTLSGIAERTGLGSSPRMRGTHVFGSISDNRTGIIPAYAGNTC